MDSLNHEIAKALQLQKELYGDLLFEQGTPPKRKTSVQHTITLDTETTASTYTSKPAPVINNSVQQEFIVNEPAQTPVDFMNEEFWKSENLDTLNKLICNCKKCPLEKGRKNFVFGSGNPNADVLVLGEGPGEQEDEQGLPFVGRSGQLLTDILKAINFSREEVYIANIVKCRPPGNRAPFASEMEQCIPYLKKQIDLIKPKAILCLGLTAAQGLLKRKESLTKMRGHTFEFEGKKVMVTYHPAALLRNPNWKRGCWEDVQAFRKMYDSLK